MGKNLIFITSEWWHIGPLVTYSKTEAEEQVYNVWGFCLFIKRYSVVSSGVLRFKAKFLLLLRFFFFFLLFKTSG